MVSDKPGAIQIGVKIVHNRSPFFATRLCEAVTENGHLIWMFAGSERGGRELSATRLCGADEFFGADPAGKVPIKRAEANAPARFCCQARLLTYFLISPVLRRD